MHTQYTTTAVPQCSSLQCLTQNTTQYFTQKWTQSLATILTDNFAQNLILPLGAVLLVCLVVNLYYHYRGKKWQYPTSDFEILHLHDWDISNVKNGGHPPVSAISFFDCLESDLPSAEAWIRARVTQIAVANRWILGRLVHATDTGRKSLAVPRSLSKEDLQRLFLTNPKHFCPSRDMNPEQLAKEYAKIILPYKSAAYDKEDVLACRFVFAHTPRGFCIVFSMSHTIGDGNTFYNIMNQLSESDEVRPLNPKRKLDFSDNIKSVVDSSMEPGIGAIIAVVVSMFVTFLVNVIKRMFTRQKARLLTGLIDNERVAQVKAEAKRRGTVPFVSTNDIITSAFANATGSDVCTAMAIDLRERMRGLTKSHAGNYIEVLLFDAANTATPDRVRLALLHPRFRCRDKPLPSICGGKILSSQYGIITNWASFSKPIHIPGCVEQLHQPMMIELSAALPYIPMAIMIVFRATAQRVGVLWLIPSRAGSDKDVLGDMPIALDTLKCSEL